MIRSSTGESTLFSLFVDCTQFKKFFFAIHFFGGFCGGEKLEMRFVCAVPGGCAAGSFRLCQHFGHLPFQNSLTLTQTHTERHNAATERPYIHIYT